MKMPLPLEKARKILIDGVGALGSEHVPIADAAGRILAQTIIARHDQPRAATSAMDGYAVRSADMSAGAKLRVIGEAPAGAPFGGGIGPGECVIIATGGIVPAGADRVVIQENVVRDRQWIVTNDPAGPPFIRPAAMDFTAGQTLVEAGAALTPAAIGLIAAAGIGSIAIARRPRVAILCGGDELCEPGQSLVPGATYNSAAYALAALVEAWGGLAVTSPILPDDSEAIVAAIRAFGDGVDVFVPLGGASVGDRDLFRAAFEAVGAEHRFWRIAVVPGKPSWHALMPGDRAVLGLPGNPSSSFVCAHLLLKPLLHALTGRDPQGAMALSPARLAGPIGANGDREAWLRATVAAQANGAMTATIDPRQDSGLQIPLLTANALVRRAAGASAADAGAMIDYLPIG